LNAAIHFPDRKEVFAQLNIALTLARAEKRRIIVSLVNLDRFYEINETRGSEFGSQVLGIMFDRLKDAVSSEGVACRLEGSKFLLVLPIADDNEHNYSAVESVKNIVERPVAYEGTEVHFTASIGSACFPQDSRISEQLVSRAETALYEAKKQGGNRIVFYREEDTRRLTRKALIETGLRPALYTGQYHIGYQPIYSLQTGRLRGFEAGIRWNHPELGIIPPAEFLPLAEHNGLIIPIGEWVLREACKLVQGMNQYGVSNLSMVVHVSMTQLLDQTLTRTVLHILDEYGLQPNHLELAVTEPAGGSYPEDAVLALGWLRAAGIGINLNKFGHGVSALSSLHQLPISGLAIDKSLVAAIEKEGSERLIVEALVTLAQKLGLEVTAAGIDSEEQYKLLQQWGCHNVQGFLLGKPSEPAMLDLTMMRK